MKKVLSALGVGLTALALVACGGGDETAKNQRNVGKDDPTKKVEVKMNLAYGSKSQTITYNQPTPLNLPDGSTVSLGALKPFWTYIENETNTDIVDVTVQDQKAKDMITTAAATGFKDAVVFGGNSIGETLMSYGVDGKLFSISSLMEQGLMPNFSKYLEANPDVKSSITAYDGNIYQVPYIAEIGEIARAFHVRETWVTDLLDAPQASYDQDAYTTYYQAFWTGSNARTGSNGGTVTPKTGVTITKKTSQNIIDIQNALTVKNGETLAKALIDYINANYDYENPSELYLGAKAAYDIDELTALFRVIKANPKYLTDGKADKVFPYFSRKSSYREDLFRFATYFDGVKVHGSDSYGSRWYIDSKGELQYTYSQESLYNVLTYLSYWQAEGLVYNDMYDLTNTKDFRKQLYGTDNEAQPAYGFMTFDFIASTTADALNEDIVGILPPVSRVNGVWQYYIDNSRVIKPDGWSISAEASDAEIARAATIFDFIFSEKGSKAQNYGMDYMLDLNGSFTGPDGKAYPKYNEWLLSTCDSAANGDLSTFLRNWMGCLMPVGYAKEIGFEYQYTSDRGFDAWALLQESTLNIPTYAGEGLKGDNDNYYKLVPPIFSLTKKQTETIQNQTSLSSDGFFEVMFNVVRYKTVGNAPAGTNVPATYADYIKVFNDAGLSVYVQTYQTAYKAMQAVKK